MQTDFFKKTTHLEEYLKFLREIRRMCSSRVDKNALHIKTVEKYIGRPLLDARTGSEIDQAIITAAKNRRTAYNGGYQDDGLTYSHAVGGNVSRYFTWAQKERLIAFNVYPKNSFPQPPTREAGVLTQDQLSKLYNCKTLEFTDFVLLRFFLDTGLRVGQVVKVRIEDINFTEQTVKSYISKVDKWHTAPISSETVTYIRKWLCGRKEGFLFPNRWGEEITPTSIRKRFVQISKKVGFRVHPHIKRHTAVTMWVEKLGQIPAMQFAGHSSVRMTNHYTHLIGKKKVEMQKEVLSEIKNIVSNPPRLVFPRKKAKKQAPKFLLFRG